MHTLFVKYRARQRQRNIWPTCWLSAKTPPRRDYSGLLGVVFTAGRVVEYQPVQSIVATHMTRGKFIVRQQLFELISTSYKNRRMGILRRPARHRLQKMNRPQSEIQVKTVTRLITSISTQYRIPREMDVTPQRKYDIRDTQLYLV